MFCGLDSETLGLSVQRGDRPFAFSFCYEDGKTVYIRFPVDPFSRRVLYSDNDSGFKELCNRLSDPDTVWVFHNASFDIPMIEAATGIDLSKSRFYDTLVLSHLINNNRLTHALKPLAKAVIGFSDADETELHKAT